MLPDVVSSSGGMTRRQALAAAGLAAAATVAPAPGLSWAGQRRPARAAAYGRLVVAAGDVPGGRFCRRDPVAATRDFARWYGSQDAAIRAHADAVLDALGPVLDGGQETPSGPPEHAALLAAAAGLAAVSCAPGLEEDDRPLPPPLWAAP